MNLYTIIRKLQEIAKAHPNVRSTGDGSIYDFMNGSISREYDVFFVEQTSHRDDAYTDITNYGLRLFYISRLDATLENNRLQIQNNAMEILRNIIRTFCDKNDISIPNVKYQPFTQKFVDETAGMYAELEFELPMENICEEIY